jgi:hypothetical protein
MMELHGSIVVTVTAMCALATKILDRFLLFLYPPLLAIVVEAGFAE